MKRVLADFHHADLFESLRILFEVRMGWELYRPYGLDWYTEGYWKVLDNIDTAKQYLDKGTVSPNGSTLNVEAMPNICARETDSQGVYTIPDSCGRAVAYKGITYKTFLDTDFDIIISSIPAHIEPFNQLAARKNLKHIFQAGNNYSYTNKSFVPNTKNVMSSALGIITHSEQHTCFYHQEFDTSRFYPSTKCFNPYSIVNFQHYKPQPKIWETLVSKLGAIGIDHSDYGDGNKLGRCTFKRIPEVIRDHGMIYHVKPQGDGFGYNIFYAFACGRPIITRVSDFAGMTAYSLLEDGITCIDIETTGDDYDALAKRIGHICENLSTYVKHVYNRFKEVVDFQKQFDEVLLPFLENLES